MQPQTGWSVLSLRVCGVWQGVCTWPAGVVKHESAEQRRTAEHTDQCCGCATASAPRLLSTCRDSAQIIHRPAIHQGARGCFARVRHPPHLRCPMVAQPRMRAGRRCHPTSLAQLMPKSESLRSLLRTQKGMRADTNLRVTAFFPQIRLSTSKPFTTSRLFATAPLEAF